MIMEYSIVDLEYFLLILILIPKEALSSHKKKVFVPCFAVILLLAFLLLP